MTVRQDIHQWWADLGVWTLGRGVTVAFFVLVAAWDAWSFWDWATNPNTRFYAVYITVLGPALGSIVLEVLLAGVVFLFMWSATGPFHVPEAVEP
jgi:hypothetical protein